MTTGRRQAPDGTPHRPRGNGPGQGDHGRAGETGGQFLDLGEIQQTEMIFDALAAGRDAMSGAGAPGAGTHGPGAPDAAADGAPAHGGPQQLRADPVLALLAALVADVGVGLPGGTWTAAAGRRTAHGAPKRKAGARRRMRAAFAIGVAAAFLTTVIMAVTGLPGPATWLAIQVRQAIGEHSPAAAPGAPSPDAARRGQAAAPVPPAAFPGIWLVPATPGVGSASVPHGGRR